MEYLVWRGFPEIEDISGIASNLTRLEKGNTLYLYLAVSDKALNFALVQEIKGEEKPIYFVSRTFKGA
jgi:hypothetical protein